MYHVSLVTHDLDSADTNWELIHESMNVWNWTVNYTSVDNA